MTTYISSADLDTLLDGFTARYYGTNLDGDEEVTTITQFYVDANQSFDETNEMLSGINSIKQLPFGTQSGGNYPYHVRMLQANLMIYARLKARHFGEFNDGIPGWINTYRAQADKILADIRGQNVVFDQDVTTGESGIGVGSWVSHSGAANLYSNWETGFYRGDDYPRVFVVEIDGTTSGSNIGQSTFKWSNDGGFTFLTENTELSTATSWTELESGLKVRWEPVGTNAQCVYGDRFTIRCTPMNIPQKGGNIRFVTFRRG